MRALPLRFAAVAAGLAFLLAAGAAAAQAASAEAGDPVVYLTETGKRYHRDGCAYLERTRIPIALSEAAALGYTPCGVCSPPAAGTPPVSAARTAAAGLYRVNVAKVARSGAADLGKMLRAVVVRHIDGDTVYVSFTQPPPGLKSHESVRLLGVDTPETVHPSKPVQRFGKQASEFTRSRLLHRVVYLAFDWELRDKYDRLLAYIYLADGSCHNAELIRQGYAHAYTRFPFQFLEEFRRLEKTAREQARGLWGPQP